MMARSGTTAHCVPPLLIGVALVVWGYSTDRLVFAVLLAALVELSHVTPLRWDLATTQYYRVADITSVAFALVAVYQFNERAVYGIYSILALTPVCVLPLLLAERYGTAGSLPASALFLSLRRRVRAGLEPEQPIHLALPYLIVTVLATSTGSLEHAAYFVTAAAFMAVPLFRARSKRYRAVMFGVALLAVAAIALSLQYGVRLARIHLEDTFSYWFNQYAWARTDPAREFTSIGTIGRLKLSDRIRVRVAAPRSIPLPLMLHETSYTRFNLGTWSLPGAAFTAIDPRPGTTTWDLPGSGGSARAREAALSVDHAADVGVAPLPYGAVRVFGDEIIELQHNAHGTVMLESIPGRMQYHVAWTGADITTDSPKPADLALPSNYAPVLDAIAAEIGLDTTDAARAKQQITGFFAEQFRYSLVQKDFFPGRTPLAHFLQQTRQGHCEYFATATTLLLRYAGIPARYAVGYVVHEYSPLEQAFIARARHAHSWVEAYIDGRWEIVDTTPAQWAALEADAVSRWQGIQDLVALIGHRYQRYQRGDAEYVVQAAYWLLPILIAALLWRVRSRIRGVRGAGGSAVTAAAQRRAGEDSEVYAICAALQRQGHAPQAGETLRAFLSRVLDPRSAGVALGRLLELHERYRYAERGLSPAERKELRRGCERYCDALRGAGS